VRFPRPVPVDSDVVVDGEIVAVDEHARGLLVRVRYTIGIAGTDAVACVAEVLSLLTEAPR
jgi:acyl dehydratase